MKRNEIPKSYKEIVKIPSDLLDKLPTSYDIIGDIALVKIDEKLYKHRKKIAKAMLETSKSIKTVCLVKPVSGELRTRQVEIIGGEQRTETIYKEYDTMLKLDVSKVYFSPRLSSERKRVADLVKKDEIIVDMFTGIAPFPIMITKYANPKIIYAIDKNKDAIEYAQLNIAKNKALDKVELFCGDTRNIIKNLIEKDLKVDRIIMNLPFSAFDFFEDALKICNDFSVIHYYNILREEDTNQRITDLKKIGEKNNFSLEKFDLHKIKSFSPREFYMGIDITAKKTKN
jgi:tRNA (guanine37-N1)-methyltransferase